MSQTLAPERNPADETPALGVYNDWLEQRKKPLARKGELPRVPLDAEERQLALLVAEEWWSEQQDARDLLRLLGRLSAKHGQGSPCHRQTVKAAVVCARTVLPLLGDQRAECESVLAELDLWIGGKDTDLVALRKRAWKIYAAAADAYAATDADAAAYAYAAADAAADAYAAAAADAAAYAYAAADAAADAYAAWRSKFADRLRELADLVRKTVPWADVAKWLEVLP